MRGSPDFAVLHEKQSKPPQGISAMIIIFDEKEMKLVVGNLSPSVLQEV